jgi:hypothetical protein
MGINIIHPIEIRPWETPYERTDIDYYVLNGKHIATVVRPLMHLHYNRYCIKVDDISKDSILRLL